MKTNQKMALALIFIVVGTAILGYSTVYASSEPSRQDRIAFASSAIYLSTGGKYWINPYNLENYEGDTVQVEEWKWP